MKLLRNRKTKALYPYSEALLRLNKNMEVYDTSLDQPAIEDMGIIDTYEPKVHEGQEEQQFGLNPYEDAGDQQNQDAGDQPIMIGDKMIGDADKKELVEYLSMAFNETMPVRATKQEIINRIKELSE